MSSPAAGLALALLGLFVILRTVVRNDDGDNLVDRLVSL